ncbi:hypothetical protein CFC21_098732 [Triticum aestivum]|uniref:Protein kinase domain-containing protein n=3 Tax=Triticum aestivum TaxID=4565 RepID=A0A3B6RM74_WHEAT|nr:hypothetical protein CFC21_098732 [Triticum aestivum]
MERNLLTGNLPESVGNLSNLFVLSLSQNKLSGSIPLSVGKLSQLSELYLQENNFSGPIPGALAGSKKLEKLNLSYNSFGGRIPKELFSLPSLSQGLDLSHNQLFGQIPPEIGSLKNLGPLNISHNQLSGQIPPTLGQCVHLESLHMEGNLFHGKIPHSFISLGGIIEMDLSQNNLSGEIPDIFKFFKSMKLLNLSFNNLEGPVPADGIFQNGRKVFIQGNMKLCTSTPLLRVPFCNAEASKQWNSSSILKIVGFTVLSLVLLSCFATIILKKKNNFKQAAHPSCKELKKFTYANLMRATNGFSSDNLIGSGKYGSVYRGRIESEEHEVAIKVFKLNQLRAPKSFIAECEALRNTRHRNLIRVITACSTIDPTGHDFKAIVLEYSVNGDLGSWLHPTVHEDGQRRPLSFGTRIVIAVDFGLAKFLHSYTSSDIHTSTSLVGPRGSVGYIAPEYGFGSKISTEGDVFSYGVIILEMLTGKRPTNEMFKDGLTLYKFFEKPFPQKIEEILDPRIVPGYRDEGEDAGGDLDWETQPMVAMNCIIKLIELGLLCSAETPKDRPTIQHIYNEVITIKESFSALQS